MGTSDVLPHVPTFNNFKYFLIIWNNLKCLVFMLESLVENPPFLTKSFQLHDICNYVSIEKKLILK